MRGWAAGLRLVAAAFLAALVPAAAFAQVPLMEPISGRARALQADQIVIGTQRISLFGIDAPDPDQDRECMAGRAYYGCFTNAKRALEILVDLGPVTCTDTGVRNYVNFPYMVCKRGDLDLENFTRTGEMIHGSSLSDGRVDLKLAPSGEDLFYHLAMHIGEAEPPTLVA